MPKGWSDEEIETAARMYAAGESFRRIGDELKKRADTVQHYIRAHSELFPEERERKDSLPRAKRPTYRSPGTCAAVTTAGAPPQITDARGAGPA